MELIAISQNGEPAQPIAGLPELAASIGGENRRRHRLEPTEDGGTVVTSFYDWSGIDEEWRKANIFPVIPETALRATLGILDRTVRRGYSRG